MGSFPEARERLQQAVFDRLGEDATWSGVPGTVRVRRAEADEMLRQTYGEVIADGCVLRVRRSEVEAPVEGDTVQILDADGNPVAAGAFVLTSAPTLDRSAVWTCRAEAQPA